MKLLNYFIIAIALFVASCNGCRQIPANQIVLNSDNYGKTWRVLNPNETVPACSLPGCYNVYLPASVMVGDVTSIQRVGKTGESARVKMLYSYQWEIEDAQKFITEAKELKKGGDYTSDGSLEFIEGRLIDKHFHDISAVLLVEEDVKNFDQAGFEKKFVPAMNDDLARFGIKILNISVVPEFGEQLETALDAAQALEVYRSIGEEELGKRIIQEKAGAPVINLNVQTNSTTQELQVESQN